MREGKLPSVFAAKPEEKRILVMSRIVWKDDTERNLNEKECECVHSMAHKNVQWQAPCFPL
jgi:hypothetical protein